MVIIIVIVIAKEPWWIKVDELFLVLRSVPTPSTLLYLMKTTRETQHNCAE